MRKPSPYRKMFMQATNTAIAKEPTAPTRRPVKKVVNADHQIGQEA